MITAYNIYEKTGEGLTIIIDLVPQAAAAVENPKKKPFKYRLDEKTPSAYLLPPDTKYPYWRLIDYGIINKPFSPVDLYMREKGMTSDQFTLALHELAEKYGIEDDKITKSNRPKWHDRLAVAGEQEEQRVFRTRDTFTSAEVNLWGPKVTEEHLLTYGWKPLEYIGTVRKGHVLECHSTENYPMFIQECHYNDEKGKQQTFYKVYKPCEYDKSHRFETIGSEPKNYMFGLEALQCAFRKNGEKKLDAVFLVSGGSDGANCLSMGGQAVWLNSETTELTKFQHDLLYEYAKTIYAIGDIDATGKRCSKLLAIRYLDIYSITLPEHLMNKFHDNRGHFRKDLKDYVQLFPNKDAFWLLVRQARRALFWRKVIDEKKGTTSYYLSPSALNYFLELNGFYTLHDENHERPSYIRIENMLVEWTLPKEIKNFLNSWCLEKGLPEKLRNVVIRSKDLPTRETSNLRELNLSFCSSTATSQQCYFRNCWLEVTGEGIKRHDYKEPLGLGNYVWCHDLIEHDYVEYKPMFTAVQREDKSFEVTLTEDAKSDFLTYLYHSSRLYWRQEDEQGEPLTEQQERDVQQCLAAKLACIGYYLHRYRDASNAYAAILQDAYLAEDEKECNGRSGKSIFLKFLMSLIHHFFIDARNPEIVRDKFLYDGVDESTDLVVVDECARTLPYPSFFGKITGPFRYEEKGGHPITIPADKAPKMIFATNYVIKTIDGSTAARIWPQVFSDYYHQKARNNDYSDSRSVRDDFGYNLIEADYPEEKWQADIAFAMQCLQFYLSLPSTERKVMPPMDFIERRTQSAIIGMTFKEWADEYYQPGEGHLDVTEKYETVLEDYRVKTGDKGMKSRVFTLKLKEYCSYAEHIYCYNPAELTEAKKDGDRIREKDDNQDRVPMIHVRSVAWVEQHDNSSNGVQTELPF